MKSSQAMWAVCSLLSTQLACEERSPVAPEPLSTSSPTSTTTSSTSTTTTTSIPPQPPQSSNRPPTVSLKGGGSCHPSAAGSSLGARPCSVGFIVEASDPDGDPFEIAWSGCTNGTGFTEDCLITRPGSYEATVVVQDVHGARTTASKTAFGVNQAPVIKFGGSPPDPAPSNTRLQSLVGGQPTDPDGDEEENTLCDRVTFTISGPCSGGVGLCGGVGDAFDVDLRTTSGPGTCVLEATTYDSWGREGRDRLTFRVDPP